MTQGGEIGKALPPAGAPADSPPTCPLCSGVLRHNHVPDADNPHGLCDPCLGAVAKYTPFAGASCSSFPDALACPAPADANLLELAAGLLLTHGALHPGEPLHLQDALAVYGVDVDHVTAHKIVNKLRRRHGLVIHGESRQTGYVVTDWTYEARRVRSSLRSA